MPGRKKPILVVAADGGAARFFEGPRIGGPFVELEHRRLKAPEAAPATKSTRVHDRFGPARHSVEARASPRMRVETRFLEQVAAAIDIGLDRFDEVVLCAPPRSLGALRVCVSDAGARTPAR